LTPHGNGQETCVEGWQNCANQESSNVNKDRGSFQFGQAQEDAEEETEEDAEVIVRLSFLGIARPAKPSNTLRWNARGESGLRGLAR
jgi:hypothetical protein